jgi:MraZ protein
LPFSTTSSHYYPLLATTVDDTVSGFLGRFEFQMDEKGRVSLPSAFRKEAEEPRFVLLQWEKPYLTLFPVSVWQEVQRRLLEYRRSDPEAGRHVREITSNAVEVTPDKQGRILIPAWLQEAASLEGTVLLNGNIDRVEIWNPEHYLEASKVGSEAFQGFAHRLFG